MADLLDVELLKKERMKRLLELQGQWSEELKQRQILVRESDSSQSVISKAINRNSPSR